MEEKKIFPRYGNNFVGYRELPIFLKIALFRPIFSSDLGLYLAHISPISAYIQPTLLQIRHISLKSLILSLISSFFPKNRTFSSIFHQKSAFFRQIPLKSQPIYSPEIPANLYIVPVLCPIQSVRWDADACYGYHRHIPPGSCRGDATRTSLSDRRSLHKDLPTSPLLSFYIS